MFTVISWCTSNYRYLAEGLISDCERLGYPFHLYEIDKEFPNLSAAWCNHPRIVRQGVEDFGDVLFLDIECRIVKPIPAQWRAPFVSVREPEQNFWIEYNTGTLMANKECIPWLDLWIKLVERWGMDNLADDAYIYWPNDIGDELPFHAAVTAMDVKLNTAKLSYIDRSGAHELSRGLWKNKYTIVQHPTIHHWPKEQDLIECKKLFIQNFPGDTQAISQKFSASQENMEVDGWVFDGQSQYYAPLEFWPAHKRQWLDADVSITSAQR